MAGDSKKLQPIIIKKVKKGGHAVHGGAWKIAYADFVTAMMAFFLLMWLLGSTSTGDLQGISDYFKTPLKVALTGGSGSGDSSSVIKGGGEDLMRSAGQVKRGEVRSKNTVNMAALREERERKDQAKFEALKTRVEDTLVKLPEWKDLKDQLRLEVTVDGLSIQIVDANNQPMFASGSSTVQPAMRTLLRTLGPLINDVDNDISLAGHTDATPYSGNFRGYSNWELSAERANASRRELVAGGMRPDKVVRVVGLGSMVPLAKSAPLDPMNRRIAIVVLNASARDRILGEPEAPVSNASAMQKAMERPVPTTEVKTIERPASPLKTSPLLPR
jgi:chemotaxis protein MotB